MCTRGKVLAIGFFVLFVIGPAAWAQTPRVASVANGNDYIIQEPRGEPTKNDVSPKPPMKPKVLKAEDFKRNKINRGSGQAEVTFVVEIHPKLPPYQFRLIPEPHALGDVRERQPVGRIEVSQFGSPSILQTIEVASHRGPDSLTQWFEAQDVNFDGYLDIAVLDDSSGKWGSFNYWLFEPKTGRFITNTLTDELREKLAYNDVVFDSKTREIYGYHLSPICPGDKSTFKILNGHLVEVEREERTQQGDDCIVTIKRPTNGELRVVKTKREAGAAKNQ